ncbi:MAG: mechanosensitive ion channel domain-containing protein [Pseudomonadota bacterium]
MPDNELQQLFARLAAPAALAQLVVIALAALAGVMASHFARAWHARSALQAGSSWQARVAEAAVLAAPSFTALVALLVGRGLIELTDMLPTLLDIALQLAAALLIVRLALYLLRLALGPQRWLHRWEIRLTIILWLLLGFSLLGWFDFVESSLDSMDLIPGKARFTLWQLLKGLVVVTLFVVATSLVSRTIEARVMKLEGLAMSTRIGISKFSYVLLLALGMLVGINAAGVDLTALTVLTGAVGLGLGFGLQTIASNFVSGFVLLLDKSIKPGDVISFTGGTGTSTENFGWVQELRGRCVVVRDRDGVDTLVPNQNLITNTVINWSYEDPKVRLKLPVRVSYRDDPELALLVLLKAAQASHRVLNEPAPVSRLMHFGESGIELELRFWISDPQEGVNNVRSDVNRAIWKHFKEHGITIPVTQREIQMTRAPGGDEP